MEDTDTCAHLVFKETVFTVYMYKRPSLRKRGVTLDMVTLGEPKYTERVRIHKRFIAPIEDLEEYLWLLQRHGYTPEEIEIARRRNTPGDPLNCITTIYTEKVYTNKPKKLKAVKKFSSSR